MLCRRRRGALRPFLRVAPALRRIQRAHWRHRTDRWTKTSCQTSRRRRVDRCHEVLQSGDSCPFSQMPWIDAHSVARDFHPFLS